MSNLKYSSNKIKTFEEQIKSGHDYLSWGETLANGLIALTNPSIKIEDKGR